MKFFYIINKEIMIIFPALT